MLHVTVVRAEMKPPSSPPRIKLAQKFEQPPRRLDLAARGRMGARLRVPGVNVEMRPRLRLVDEPAKEQRRGDRPGHAAPRPRIRDVADRPLDHRIIGAPERHPPYRIASARRVGG